MDDSLSFESLFRGARKFARSALEAHGAEEEEVFLLHAGVSVERLAKAALAKKSPFLLMEMKGKDDTLYHLTGVRQAAKLRTVGAGQAISRLRDMAVLPQRDPDLDELIELRNGVAHLMASVDESFDGFTVFCRVPAICWTTWAGTKGSTGARGRMSFRSRSVTRMRRWSGTWHGASSRLGACSGSASRISHPTPWRTTRRHSRSWSTGFRSPRSTDPRFSSVEVPRLRVSSSHRGGPPGTHQARQARRVLPREPPLLRMPLHLEEPRDGSGGNTTPPPSGGRGRRSTAHRHRGVPLAPRSVRGRPRGGKI